MVSNLMADRDQSADNIFRSSFFGSHSSLPIRREAAGLNAPDQQFIDIFISIFIAVPLLFVSRSLPV